MRPTSRTAAGTLDVSSTPGKAERSVEGLTPEEAKAKSDPKSLLIGQPVAGLDPHRVSTATGTLLEVAQVSSRLARRVGSSPSAAGG
jgi:hypothetical protein